MRRAQALLCCPGSWRYLGQALLRKGEMSKPEQWKGAVVNRVGGVQQFNLGQRAVTPPVVPPSSKPKVVPAPGPVPAPAGPAPRRDEVLNQPRSTPKA